MRYWQRPIKESWFPIMKAIHFKSTKDWSIDHWKSTIQFYVSWIQFDKRYDLFSRSNNQGHHYNSGGICFDSMEEPTINESCHPRPCPWCRVEYTSMQYQTLDHSIYLASSRGWTKIGQIPDPVNKINITAITHKRIVDHLYELAV